MLATATIPPAEAENPSTILPVVRVEYTNVEDFLVDYTERDHRGYVHQDRASHGCWHRLRCESSYLGWRVIDVEAEVR